jgi:hypothetical protein
MFYGLRTVENVDVEILRFQSTEEPRVAGAFEYDGRHYPAIVVASQGGTVQFLDLADHVGVVVDTLEYAKEPSNYATITTGQQVAARFFPSGSMSVERIQGYLSRVSGGGETDITVSVREDDSGKPSESVLASGSIRAWNVDGWDYREAYLDDAAPLVADTPYWVVLATESADFSAEYRLGRQTGYGEGYLWGTHVGGGGWTTESDSALSLKVFGGSYERIGAAARLTVQISCAAKSDRAAMRLSDLSEMYLFLARKRSSGYLREQNIHVLSIRSGGITRIDPTEDRPDPVYVSRLFVDVRVEFWQDFSVGVLKALGIEVETY